jgi:hypothetical protein
MQINDFEGFETEFNDILTNRLGWEKEHDFWEEKQLKDALASMTHNKLLANFIKHINACEIFSNASKKVDFRNSLQVEIENVGDAIEDLFSISGLVEFKNDKKKLKPLDKQCVSNRITTFARRIASALKQDVEIADVIFAAEEFKEILQSCIQSEKPRRDMIDSSWGHPRYKDALSSLGYDSKLKALANQTNATSLLSYAWKAYAKNEEEQLPPKIKEAVETLFSTKEAASLNEDTLLARFQTFASYASQFTGIGTVENQYGMILNIEAPVSQKVSESEEYPELKLLISQQTALIELIKKMGRQTDSKSWSKWFENQFNTVKHAIPALVKMSVCYELSRVINTLLGGVGLGYSIAGYSGNIITFGSSILTPLQATITFPQLMKKQLVLYRLKEYGVELKMYKNSTVMNAIQASIVSIDWIAVKMAFNITPFGLLISAYSLVKLTVNKVNPSTNEYYSYAKTLIDSADQIHTSPIADALSESKLARMTILHLASSPEKFLEIMTCRKDDAYKILSGLMNF